ncbi:endonuclease V [Parachryseolinea silvisoli]|jgi:deoxyribonuclease V|uniref:endonuclease V n=1 Tax=Parachryseolinea silvisoli TaxID=2873601 RepID=UPI002265BAED|nr:endonuclease V [Parachryseolinea silvisoli]MCD9015975.1 endonuclease V [Parachryseolinea silvisoli]
MLAAFDTYYTGTQAKTVCVLFEQWQDATPAQVLIDVMEDVPAYEPGAFYKRELPCIMRVLQQVEIASLQAIIIDGFVILDDAGKLGLGGHLYEQLGRRVPVIGVAKTNFATNKVNKQEVLRGESLRPLYITVLGMSLPEAATHIHAMHGVHRMPALLKHLDSLTKA